MRTTTEAEFLSAGFAANLATLQALQCMLIDWITARVDLDRIGEADRRRLRTLGDRIQRFNPLTGEVAWESTAWNSIRSDSHKEPFVWKVSRMFDECPAPSVFSTSSAWL